METLGHCQADIFIAPFFAAVDCQWSGWGDWSPCSVTCGQGTMTRGRSKLPAKNGGAECQCDSESFCDIKRETIQMDCNLNPCPGIKLSMLWGREGQNLFIFEI